MNRHYAIRHLTRFVYQTPVSECVMELRMRPSNTGMQQCLQFEIDVSPRARVFAYRDFRGNWVHHFDVPRRHAVLAITARAQVRLNEPDPLPGQLSSDAWAEIDSWHHSGEEWDYLQPSRFAEWSDALLAFSASLGDPRQADPLTTLRHAMASVHQAFEYAPNSTRVDSPIDETLASRRGVCQDFTHITIAALRRMGVPARYVSGYIAPRELAADAPATAIATHAWVEARLPGLGWVGVDPTHNTQAGLRHVRVAVGRDYADVPPTRGIFKGQSASALQVSVEVAPADALPTLDRAALDAVVLPAAAPSGDDDRARLAQEQAQQ